MKGFLSMSATQALLVAVAWPVALLGIPALLTFVAHNAGTMTGGRVEVVTAGQPVPGSRWIAVLVLAGPPVLFLIVWAIARRPATR